MAEKLTPCHLAKGCGFHFVRLGLLASKGVKGDKLKIA